MGKKLTLSTSTGFGVRKRVLPMHHRSRTNQARQTSHFQILRSSIGIKLGQGPCFFSRGDHLDGVLMVHPVNASRKLIISTELGTFNVNEEDIEEV